MLTGSLSLHRAVRTGNVASALALLEAGADLEALDAGGKAPLHRAVEGGCIGTVSLLLAHGAAVNARTASEDTPLHLVAALELDAGESDEDYAGRRFSACRDSTAILELLLLEGADVTAKSRGCTALHLAAMVRHSAAAALLCAARPDARLVVGGYGCTPHAPSPRLCEGLTYATIASAAASLARRRRGMALFAWQRSVYARRAAVAPEIAP